MRISELNLQLTNELKKFIKSEGYVDSGKLIKSIKFNCTFRNNDLKIKFNSLDYINYLDDGNLLTKFFDKNDIRLIIQEFYVDNLDLGLD